jgi:hypothetical protein
MVVYDNAPNYLVAEVEDVVLEKVPIRREMIDTFFSHTFLSDVLSEIRAEGGHSRNDSTTVPFLIQHTPAWYIRIDKSALNLTAYGVLTPCPSS